MTPTNNLSLEKVSNFYPKDDPVHGLAHIVRVYQMAIHLAKKEGANLEIVGAAALLHDAESDEKVEQQTQKPVKSGRASHHLNSAGIAARVLADEGWSEERILAVQHCIRAHRFRQKEESPQTLEAKVLFDADKLDAIGATGVARAIGYAVQHKQPFYASVSEQFISRGITEPGEPHSAYHEYVFKLRLLKERLFTTSAKTIADQRHKVMEDYFFHLRQESELSVE